MPRRSGQRKGKSSRISVTGYLNQADIKLGDFADNPATKLPSRISKKAYHIKYDKMKIADLCKEPKSQLKSKLTTQEADSQIEQKEMKEDEDLAWDERDWDEKDLSDFQTDASYSSHRRHDEDEDDEEDDDDIVNQRGKKASKKKNKKKPPATDEGRVYPNDLWYILADYIRPEDIGTYACLCKAAYGITRTASFWKKLYYRFINSSTTLPPYLQSRGSEHPRGLRAFVIRALYFLHEPYRLSLSAPSPVGEGRSSPEAVTDFTCLYTWSNGKIGHHFTHFMKLRHCSKDTNLPHPGVCYDPNIFANDNRGECILRVHCEHFQDVPSAKIMGLQLVRSSVCVSRNMRYHRVKLEFGRKDRRGFCVKSSVVTFFLDPVLKVDVLHWWHPQFKESSKRFIDKAVAENAANLRENNAWEGL